MNRFFERHALFSVQALVRQLPHADPLQKARIFFYLGQLKDTSVLWECVDAFSHPSWRVRTNAVRAVGNMLDRRRLGNLVSIRKAFERAHKAQNTEAIQSVLVKDRDGTVLWILKRALPLDEATYSSLEGMSSHVQKKDAVQALSRFIYRHLDRIDPLLEKWIVDIKRSDDIGLKLMPYLNDPDPAVVRASAYALGQMGYAPAIPEIETLLHASAFWLRDAAVLALALFKERTLPYLETAIKKESPGFKILALDILARIGSDGARALVEILLDDPDPNVRRAAKQSLSKF